MEAQVIPFPSGFRELRPPRIAVGSGIVPEAAPPKQGNPVVVVALELRRLVHAGMPLSYGAEAALRKRCVSAGLKALSAECSEVRLAGADEWLVMEATFEGVGATVAAAAAVLAADLAVRGIGAGEFVIAGAAASGRVERIGPIAAMHGAPLALLAELWPKAAPGQVLLGGEEWAAERRIEVLPANEVELASRFAPVFVLRGTS